MKEFFKRLIVRITAAELLAFVVGALYCCGVVSLLLHASVNLYGEPFDYSGFKPLVVGLMYLIYLVIPVAVVGCEYNIFRRVRPIGSRIFLALLTLCLFAYIVPSALHGFFPVMTVGFSDKTSTFQYWWHVCTRFWRLVYYPHLSIVFVFVLCVYVAVCVCRRHMVVFGYRVKLVEKVPCWCSGLFLFMGVLSCFLPFVQDVYGNISQGAYGGAPRGVLMTVRNPPKNFISGYEEYWEKGEDFTAPVLVVAEGDDYLVIRTIRALNDLNDNHPDLDTVLTQTRVQKRDVVDLVPILYYVYYMGGRLNTAIDLDNDIVRRLDVEMRLNISRASNNQNGYSVFNAKNTDEPFIRWTIDGVFASVRENSSWTETDVGGTNIILRMVFPDISWRGCFNVADFVQLFLSKAHPTWFEVCNLPKLENGARYNDAIIAVRCNMYFMLDMSFEGVYDPGVNGMRFYPIGLRKHGKEDKDAPME